MRSRISVGVGIETSESDSRGARALTLFFTGRERRFRGGEHHVLRTMSGTVAIVLKPTPYGWSVCLTNGRVLARFRGPGARLRALLYVRRVYTPCGGLT
jgi:hypothetical protein